MATQERNFAYKDVLPATWTDAAENLLAAATPNLNVQKSGTTSVQVVAGGDVGRVSAVIDGKWRWIDATQTRAHPGGAAGTYDVYVVAADNSFAPGDSTTGEIDNTFRGFELRIVAGGAAAPTGTLAGGQTIARTRKIRTLLWDGTRITRLNKPSIDQHEKGQLPIGSCINWSGDGDPPGGEWVLAEGRLIDIATYPDYFAITGHRYNGGVDPGGGKVRIQDRRGRVSVGPDNMGTAQGAANRLPNSNRVSGQTGGEERHVIAQTELPALQLVPSAMFDSAGVFNNGDGFARGNSNGGSSGIPGSARVPLGGGGVGMNNLQPYEVDPVIVRIA